MKPYLLISLSDFPYSVIGKTPEEKFRSLERYLEKNFIPFECEGEEMTIFVKDEFEARMIGTDFRLKKLQYYVHGKYTELNLEKIEAVRQPRLKKSKREPNEFTSLKSMRQAIYTEKKEDMTPLSVLIKKRILTKEEYKKGVKDGTFHPVVIGRRRQILNVEIRAFLQI